MGKSDMSISAFARRSLLSIKALRLYDESGLLRPERIHPSSGYRFYTESQLETARLISLLRKLDVPLAEISQMVRQNPEETSRSLAAWWDAEEGKMDARRDLARFIQDIVLKEPAGRTQTVDGYEICARQVPETSYLYHSGHVHGPDLPTFIGRSTAALTKRAEHYGGAIGHSIVVFHGVVDLDSDGPADVCIPIASGSSAKGDDTIRTESAHLQAYTTLRKHQVAFPQILQVYAALRRWVEANGYAVAGPPREIYLEDFVASAHNEQICQIAFPVQQTKGPVHE